MVVRRPVDFPVVVCPGAACPIRECPSSTIPVYRRPASAVAVPEVDPAVVAVARTKLRDANAGALDDPRIRLILDDAMMWLRVPHPDVVPPGGFDAVIVVDAPQDLQLQRMQEDRDWTLRDAEGRIAAQATREERRAVATHVLTNDGSLAQLRDQVEAVHAELAARAERTAPAGGVDAPGH